MPRAAFGKNNLKRAIEFQDVKIDEDPILLKQVNKDLTIDRIPIFEHKIKNLPIRKDSGVIELPESNLGIQILDLDQLSGAKPKT